MKDYIRFTLRLPGNLWDVLRKKAHSEERSFNGEIVHLLSSSLQGELEEYEQSLNSSSARLSQNISSKENAIPLVSAK